MWARDLGVCIGLIPGVRGWCQGVLGTKGHLQWQQLWESVWPQASSGSSHPSEGVWCPGVRAAASGHGAEVMVSSGESLGGEIWGISPSHLTLNPSNSLALVEIL